MDFGALALVIGAGLLGPALASTKRLTAPLVVGELLAGIAIGQSGLRLVDATSPSLAGLSQIGFALLMLIAGTHLPLRAPGLRGALVKGVAAAALAFVLAVPLAELLAHVTPFNQPALLILLLATSSSAVVMPLLAEGGPPAGGRVLLAITWVAVADVASVIGIPIATAQGSVGKVIAGSVLVIALAGALYFVMRFLDRTNLTDRTERIALEHGWGLRLRLSVFALFVLAWIATSFETSVLIAGFSLGFALALVGEPRTLARELIGVGDGFFVPIFFVVLGARLDVRALFTEPSNLVLLAALVAGIVLLHVVTAMILRTGWPSGLIASAQLGVPSAIVAVGLGNGTIRPGEGAAIVTAAIVTVAIASYGAARVSKGPGRAAVGTPAARPAPQP